MYTKGMNATEFRKNLFQTLEEAADGRTVIIEYKGRNFRLEAERGAQSKLSRAVRRRALLVDPDSIVGPDPEIGDLLERRWREGKSGR